MRRLALSLLLMGLPLAGCERAPLVEPEPGAPTLAEVQAQVFTPSCALSGCHLGAGAPFGLDLSEGRAYTNTVGVRSGEVPALFRIAPGDPDASYLVHKVEGREGIVGARMPLGRPPLSEQRIALLREWIADGAPES